MAPAHATSTRVAVQSPRRLLRDTLAACLAIRPGVTVVGKVAEPGDIRALCDLRRPDVVIIDAGYRLGEIALLMRSLLRAFPELSVIVTYGTASEGDVAAAVAAGISALVPESHGLAAVLALLGRRRGLDPRSGRGGMTDRELEIVVLTGSGHSVPEIADLLGISPLRVENLKRSVYAKLDVSSGAQAVSRLSSLGMLDRRPGPAVPPRAASDGFPTLTVLTGRDPAVLQRVVAVLAAAGLPSLVVREPGPVADQHWASWHRGPICRGAGRPAAAGLGHGGRARRARHPGPHCRHRPDRASRGAGPRRDRSAAR